MLAKVETLRLRGTDKTDKVSACNGVRFATDGAERMKAGTKLKSAVDDTEVMVIKAPAGGGVVSCGGSPMGEQKPVTPSPINMAFADGTQTGKRYVDAGGTIEILCIKAGRGSLALDGTALQAKDAKPLPSSD